MSLPFKALLSFLAVLAVLCIYSAFRPAYSADGPVCSTINIEDFLNTEPKSLPENVQRITGDQLVDVRKRLEAKAGPAPFEYDLLIIDHIVERNLYALVFFNEGCLQRMPLIVRQELVNNLLGKGDL